MTYDVAVVGSPFLDLTFEGLPDVPGPGEELLASELHISAGGAAITAIGAARLGLRAALVSPIGDDLPGAYLRQILLNEGVAWYGPEAERTAVTAVMPVAGDRAMATYDSGADAGSADVAAVEAGAFVVSLRRIELVPPGRRVYAVSDYSETLRPLVAWESELSRVHTFIMNEGEARRLTGARDAEAAARSLREYVPVAVVTRGPRGAVAFQGATMAEAEGLAVAARDTTGAGDLFVSAYVWADMRGLDIKESLQWAVVYSGLSVTRYSSLAGAPRLAELTDAAAARGLVARYGDDFYISTADEDSNVPLSHPPNLDPKGAVE